MRKPRIWLWILCLGANAGLAAAQANAMQAIPVREIVGEVRLAGRLAPKGVPVLLRVVFNRDLIEADQQEAIRTLTDASGKFAFHHLEALGENEGKELYQVSATYDGYLGGQQLMDLTESARGEVKLELPRIARTLPAGGSSSSAGKTTPAGNKAGASAPNGTRLPRDPQAQAALDRAQELLFRKKDPEASIPEFKKAMKLDPWYGPGYVLMGLAYMQMKNWDSARLAFEEATKVEPGNAQGYLGIGSALNEQREFGSAQNALEHSLELKPDSAEAHYELARAMYAQSNWKAALPHAQKAVEINPEYAGPHVLLGNIYVQAENPEGALAEFRTYLRLEPEGSMVPEVKDMIAQLERILAE